MKGDLFVYKHTYKTMTQYIFFAQQLSLALKKTETFTPHINMKLEGGFTSFDF